jgi:hypothetical protein
MNELDLYRFLISNHVEMRWSEDVLSAWIPHYRIIDFSNLISSALRDGGIVTRLKEGGCLWVDLVPICDFYGIDPQRILPYEDD